MERRFRILVVADSETQGLQVSLQLENEGWRVSRAATAEDALQELDKGLPDLLVIDDRPPGMRGDDLCRRIRANPATKGLRVLMITVDDEDTREVHESHSGADGYISRTALEQVLPVRIRALLHKTQTVKCSSSGLPQASLLAIDDSPTHLEYLATELREKGYRVEKATNGADGIRRLGNGAFDCVLVDLVMPEMDGIEVCRRIASIRPALKSPVGVIMLTALESQEDMIGSLEAGADDFVVKSNDLAVLNARIQALLLRNSYQKVNGQMAAELIAREQEAILARADRELAEGRAGMAERLYEANQELGKANLKLKQTQTHLVHTEKMASLGQLVAGIAHEINNPVAFILSHLFTVEQGLESIQQEVSQGLSEMARAKFQKVRVRVGEMKEGMDRVKEIVLNLRTFSRLGEAEFKTIDIHETIDSVVRFLQHKMQGRILLEKHYGEVEPLSCHAGGLNQVLMNLIANAVDAIEAEGQITLTTSQTDKEVLISVRDTGKGVPENIRNHIFEPFFTTKPLGRGTGLGLAISYGIIQDHHGSIEVESQDGAGTQFTVRIPLDCAARNEQRAT